MKTVEFEEYLEQPIGKSVIGAGLVDRVLLGQKKEEAYWPFLIN